MKNFGDNQIWTDWLPTQEQKPNVILQKIFLSRTILPIKKNNLPIDTVFQLKTSKIVEIFFSWFKICFLFVQASLTTKSLKWNVPTFVILLK